MLNLRAYKRVHTIYFIINNITTVWLKQIVKSINSQLQKIILHSIFNNND